MKLSFTHFVCKVCLTDVLNCYIDGKFLIHGHGYRVLVLWSVIIQDFRLRGAVRPVSVTRGGETSTSTT